MMREQKVDKLTQVFGEIYWDGFWLGFTMGIFTAGGLAVLWRAAAKA